jgi:hypothetical protein
MLQADSLRTGKITGNFYFCQTLQFDITAYLIFILTKMCDYLMAMNFAREGASRGPVGWAKGGLGVSI